MYAAVSAACGDGRSVQRRDFDGNVEITYQIIQLNGVDTLVDTSNDLHGNGGSIDVVGVKAVTQPRDTGCDLVELDTLLASICVWISILDEMMAML